MKQSVELRDLVLRFYEAFSSGDISLIEKLYSQKDEVLLIGSDSNEWWAGYKTIISKIKSQLGEMSGVKIVDVDTKAYSEETVGWFASRAIMKMPDDLEIPFRFTGVYHQEDGSWKILQWHASIGVSNEEVFGRKLTT
jgi:hypothetical protein